MSGITPEIKVTRYSLQDNGGQYPETTHYFIGEDEYGDYVSLEAYESQARRIAELERDLKRSREDVAECMRNNGLLADERDEAVRERDANAQRYQDQLRYPEPETSRKDACDCEGDGEGRHEPSCAIYKAISDIEPGEFDCPNCDAKDSAGTYVNDLSFDWGVESPVRITAKDVTFYRCQQCGQEWTNDDASHKKDAAVITYLHNELKHLRRAPETRECKHPNGFMPATEPESNSFEIVDYVCIHCGASKPQSETRESRSDLLLRQPACGLCLGARYLDEATPCSSCNAPETDGGQS